MHGRRGRSPLVGVAAAFAAAAVEPLTRKQVQRALPAPSRRSHGRVQRLDVGVQPVFERPYDGHDVIEHRRRYDIAGECALDQVELGLAEFRNAGGD